MHEYYRKMLYYSFHASVLCDTQKECLFSVLFESWSQEFQERDKKKMWKLRRFFLLIFFNLKITKN